MERSDPGVATVIVVDADPGVVSALEPALEPLSHAIGVEWVESPEAVDGETIANADCIVSEYEFPVGDGLALLSRVRRLEDTLPFVFYTAAGDESVASDAIAAGVTDYVTKDEGRVQVLANRIVHAIEQSQAIERAAQIERVNEVLRRVSGALVRADTRGEIEQAVCDILGESEQYRFTWIGEYQPEHDRLVPRAHAGTGADFLEQIPVGEGTTLPDEGPGPRALETGEVQVTQDVSRDAAFDDYAETVDAHGYRSVATVPLAHESDCYGLLAIYADRPDAFDSTERSLLAQLGQDIGHAIHAVDLQAELNQYREAVEHGAHGMAITDPDGTIRHVNPAFVRQTGRPEDSLVGSRLTDIQPVGPADILDPADSLSVDGNWKRELVATRGDGTEYVAEQTIAPIRREDGDLDGFVLIQADVTERRERETAIRREREMLDSLLETSPTGIVVLDPEGSILRTNKRAEEILGLPETTITDLTYDEPTWRFTDASGDPLPDDEHPFRIVLEEQTDLYDLEARMERAHADPIWVSINGAPLSAPDGTLERLVFTFDDITAIKTAQRELEETNRTLDALFQAAPVGIIAQDPDQTITLYNDGAEEIFGWPAEEVVGRDHPPFVSEAAAGEYRQFFDRTLGGESFTGLEIQRTRKDGSRVDLHLSAAPIRDADGTVTGVMAVFADLTDQKRRERQLRQFREAVEHAGHSVMITDTEGVIQYVNPAFESQTGYTAADALGRTPAILNSGEHDASFFADMWDTIGDGEVWEHEIKNRRKDGSLVHVDQTIAPVFGDEDTIEYFVAVNHDITRRRERELELERQNQRLEEFASVVSHDLRNPLNVAQGSLDLLDADGDHAERLAESLSRMEAIIDDVLTLAREGQTVEALEPLDVSALAEESWAAVDGERASLTVEPGLTIEGDPNRARRVLENLCRNAVEHAGPEVAVEVGSLDGGFYVTDDGPGIDPATREQVFESGYTTASDGTGLGLAIVRRLAEAQGWTVSLAAQSDGARFEFRRASSQVDGL